MTPMTAETNSFLSKLLQLNSCGFNAQLYFNACGGRVYVNLNADLGYDFGIRGQSPSCVKKRPSPSRIRRRLRRSQAARPTDATNTNIPCNDDLSSSDDATAMPDQVILQDLSSTSNPETDLLNHSILSTEPENIEPSQTEFLPCQKGTLMENHDVLVSSSECSDKDLVTCTSSWNMSTPNQADDWSQKLYTELDAIFQRREDRYNNRMDDHIKLISENFYSKIKAKLEHPSNPSPDEQEEDLIL